MQTSTAGTDDSGVPTLNELVGEQKRRRGFSYADLEKRPDSVIRQQRWQLLDAGMQINKFPDPATIETIDKDLQAHTEVVSLLAARSIGLDIKPGAQTSLRAMLPYSAYKLTPNQCAAIISAQRTLAYASRRGPGGTESERLPDDLDRTAEVLLPGSTRGIRVRRDTAPRWLPPRPVRLPLGKALSVEFGGLLLSAAFGQWTGAGQRNCALSQRSGGTRA